MPLPLLALGIGAAGALGSSLLGNAGAKNRQDQANKQNIKFWNMQNAYNSPTSQMSRLREAGLNPNMIYGSSANTGNASPVAPAKPAAFNMENPISSIKQFAETQNVPVVGDNLKAQNTILAQDALIKMNTKTMSDIDTKIHPELAKTSLQALKANTRVMEQNAIGSEIDNSFKNQALANQVKQINMNVMNAKATLKGTNLSNKLKLEELELRKLGIMNNDPWYFRIFGKNPEATNSILKTKIFKK